jgi:large subunit ribosomal protein L32
MTPLPKRRISSRRKGKRRAAIKLIRPTLAACPNCGLMKKPHQECPGCHIYRKAKKEKFEKAK